MAKVELKQPVVDEISEQIKDAQSVVLVDYRGLTVAHGTDCEQLSDLLEGTNAIAISKDDATAPARIITKVAKDAPALEIKAGIVEGSYYDAAGTKTIASVPSRDELLSRLLGSLQSPITNFARVLKQIADKGGGDAAEAAAPAEEAPAAE